MVYWYRVRLLITFMHLCRWDNTNFHDLKDSLDKEYLAKKVAEFALYYLSLGKTNLVYKEFFDIFPPYEQGRYQVVPIATLPKIQIPNSPLYVGSKFSFSDNFTYEKSFLLMHGKILLRILETPPPQGSSEI